MVKAEDSADAASVRNAIRWGLLLAALGTAGFRLPRLVKEGQAWREAQGVGVSSDVEGWHRVLLVDLTGVLVVLAIGIGVFFLLRPKAKPAT
jgi:hypothetical protein